VRNLLLVNLVQKLSKSVNICKSYCTTFTGTVFYGPQCILEENFYKVGHATCPGIYWYECWRAFCSR